jgi:hypothetical protein
VAPQVADLGGTVLSNPKVQLIAYAQDPFVSDVESFITEFGSSAGWAVQTGEYGVGAFTQLPTILIPGTPPATLNDDTGSVTPFQQTLLNNITGASPAWAPEDGNTMYVFLLPLGTDISAGGSCCQGFLGYHFDVSLPTGGSAPYSVVCHCAASSGDSLTPLQGVTTTVSHEMVETVTDPSGNDPAFAQANDANVIWTFATGGEVADMCELNADANYQPPGASYMLQRSWSNAAAAAGTNPCVPVPDAGAYFNAYPQLPDAVTLGTGGSRTRTRGVAIPVGQTRTIDVVLASDGPTAGPWTVQAWDINEYLGYTPVTTTLSLDRDTGVSGDVLHLTITVNAYDPSYGGAGFVLESTLGGQDNLTMAAVGQ